MAFISEIHYRSGDVNASDPTTYEFVEITLSPGEDPADFVVGFYDTNGALMDGSGYNIQATGVVDAEVTLADLVGIAGAVAPHPTRTDYTIYTITSTNSTFRLVNAGNGQSSIESNYVALTNTATGDVTAVGIGRNPTETLSGGEADGATTTVAASVGRGSSVQFDIDGNNISGPRTNGDSVVPCFCSGTKIATPSGPKPIESLATGDLILTQSQGAKPLRWIGQRTVRSRELHNNPNLYPVRITKGALGAGLPKNDLLVSRQHRMLVSSPVAKRMFGETSVFVAAIRLTELPGIYVDTSVKEVTYFHLLFDDHEIVTAEGTESESLYLGACTMMALPAEALEEIQSLFPEVFAPDFRHQPAGIVPERKQQKRLIQRLLRNEKPAIHC